MVEPSSSGSPSSTAAGSPAKLLELRGISKRFGATQALQQVSLGLKHGQILAVVGENGAGKSTLMKVLSGVHRPDEGSIWLEGREVHLRDPAEAQAQGINIIYQEFSLVPYLNVVENLFLGRELTNRFGVCAGAEMRRQAQGILERLGAQMSLSAPVASLSVAQQQFVEIAKALLRQTRILIMDEPTATLTPKEVGRLFQPMRELAQQGIAILFISHHLEEVFAIADEIVCLRDGRCVGERPAAGCSREELIRMMVGRELSQNFPPKASQFGPCALEVRQLQRKRHLPAVSFQLREGEILGVAGLVGAGRTKMVRALVGAERAYRYDVLLRGKPLKVRNPAQARAAGMGLAPEARKEQGLVLEGSVQDNILLANWAKVCQPLWGFIRPGAARAATVTQVEELHIKSGSIEQAVGTLSGGNQQKVVLGRWLHAGCKVLIFDEPTRGIDVGAKAELYQLMRRLTAQGVAILMISSELPELLGMSDRLLVMRGQQIEHVFEANQSISEESILAYATGGGCG